MDSFDLPRGIEDMDSIHVYRQLLFSHLMVEFRTIHRTPHRASHRILHRISHITSHEKISQEHYMEHP